MADADQYPKLAFTSLWLDSGVLPE
jgi:hypothetical protein